MFRLSLPLHTRRTTRVFQLENGEGEKKFVFHEIVTPFLNGSVLCRMVNHAVSFNHDGLVQGGLSYTGQHSAERVRQPHVHIYI